MIPQERLAQIEVGLSPSFLVLRTTLLKPRMGALSTQPA